MCLVMNNVDIADGVEYIGLFMRETEIQNNEPDGDGDGDGNT